MNGRIEVGILGATGTVGQRFLQLLADHPWFAVSWLGASDKSAGKRYRDACTWQLEGQPPAGIADKVVEECVPGKAPRLVFSSMASSLAGEIERDFAAAGHLVVSNSSHFRMAEDVPLLVPEINADHLGLLQVQKERGWKGAVVTNPNCAAVVLVMPLAPLRRFGLKRVMVTTFQAVSGAGYPGVPSLDILGNVIPFIGGDEEEKVEAETPKILGAFAGGKVEPFPVAVSASCNRVPTIDGHLVTASVELADKPGLDEVVAALRDFTGLPQERELPSAPRRPIHVMEAPDRPQTRKDAHLEGGMATAVGRVRACNVLDVRFVALSHNVLRGAAGAAVLNAELLHSEGLLAAS
jgi:aspartate-semialdehyde dehydrogenase